MATMLAFTVEHAARITGVSERRIRYWDETGVLSPSIARGKQRSAYNRVYSFRDLVGLRTLGQLRDNFRLPLQTLRSVGERLQKHYEAPWSSLRFYVDGGHLFFRDPESKLLLSAVLPGQIAMRQMPNLEQIALQTEVAARKLTERTSDQLGEIDQDRYVLNNRPVLAGTRIPTAAVWEFHEAGYDARSIIELYPQLTDQDVDAAIEYERNRRLLNKRAS